MVTGGMAYSYSDEWAEGWYAIKRARIEASKRAARIAHRDACTDGILTARSVAAALPGRRQAACSVLNLATEPAQGKGPCLPLPLPEIGARQQTRGERSDTASALTSAPAGVPGGFGSRGAASVVVA